VVFRTNPLGTEPRKIRRNRIRNGYWPAAAQKAEIALPPARNGKKAATVRRSAVALYRTPPPALRKTLTLDNGKELAEHQQFEAEALWKAFFAKPYRA